MTSTIEFHLNSNFCNSWPLISVEVNGHDLWTSYVDHAQTVKIDFEVNPTNCIRIKYLNKQQGPKIWDTKLDAHGNMSQDQNCVLSDIKIGNSRCDFLLLDLMYHNQHSGTIDAGLYGFMSSRGYYQIEFPQDFYKWILDQRRSRLFDHNRRSSSLDYWTNYMGNNSDSATDELIHDIKILLNQL